MTVSEWNGDSRNSAEGHDSFNAERVETLTSVPGVQCQQGKKKSVSAGGGFQESKQKGTKDTWFMGRHGLAEAVPCY